jgi:lipid-A-disaccharide synthase
MTELMRVALVAGEASGDILGAGLMQALKAQHPQIEFIGIGGPLMQAQGLNSYFPMERLSVMGLVEVLGRLPELLARRKRLIQTLIAEKPDVFIGIDAPDFNLTLELKLADRAGAREALDLPQDSAVVALLPGSRGGEVARLGSLFLDAAVRLRTLRPGIRFVLPCASPERRAQLEQMLVGRDLPLTLLNGRSHEALAACDAVLIASGTATLEALLYKRPMVVAYKVAPMTYRILKRLVSSDYISLPNLLAERLLVPEMIQDAATAEVLAQLLAPLLDGGEVQTEGFDVIHRALRRDASVQAAQAVLKLVGRN